MELPSDFNLLSAIRSLIDRGGACRKVAGVRDALRSLEQAFIDDPNPVALAPVVREIISEHTGLSVTNARGLVNQAESTALARWSQYAPPRPMSHTDDIERELAWRIYFDAVLNRLEDYLAHGRVWAGQIHDLIRVREAVDGAMPTLRGAAQKVLYLDERALHEAPCSVTEELNQAFEQLRVLPLAECRQIASFAQDEIRRQVVRNREAHPYPVSERTSVALILFEYRDIVLTRIEDTLARRSFWSSVPAWWLRQARFWSA